MRIGPSASWMVLPLALTACSSSPGEADGGADLALADLALELGAADLTAVDLSGALHLTEDVCPMSLANMRCYVIDTQHPFDGY